MPKRMERRKKERKAGKLSRENLNEELYIWDISPMDFTKMNWRDFSHSSEQLHASKCLAVPK